MFKEFWRKNFKGDRLIWGIYFTLLFISFIEMYSATSSLAYGSVFRGNYNGPIIKHILYGLTGAAVAFVFHLINFRRVGKLFALLGWPISFILVTIVSFTGTATNDARRWLEIPFIGSFQPSELLKLTFVVALAYCFSKFSDEDSKKSLRWWCIGISTFTALIIFKENFSNSMIVVATAFLIWVVFFNKRKLLVVTLIAIAILVALASKYVYTESYQDFKTEMYERKLARIPTVLGRFDRFVTAKEPDEEGFRIDNENFQEVHGKIAIANSNGLGLGPGRSRERDILPQAYADFIFAIIVEELGIFGGGLVIMCYLWLFYRIGCIVAKCKTRFCAVTAAGLGLMIALQALVNTSVAVGLFPVTGQPLPLISRGGTSAIIISVYFGILLSISRYECGEDQNKEEKETAVASTTT